MLLFISDASVLIDIELAELTSAMFSLPYQFAVPDILFDEELKEQHSGLLQFGLISQALSGDLVSEASTIKQSFSHLSLNDALTLVLARHQSCCLLTGDKLLRKIAEKLNVEVHGIVWLVEQMIIERKISVAIARVAFQHIRQIGSRLPWDKIEKMLQKNEID